MFSMLMWLFRIKMFSMLMWLFRIKMFSMLMWLFRIYCITTIYLKQIKLTQKRFGKELMIY